MDTKFVHVAIAVIIALVLFIVCSFMVLIIYSTSVASSELQTTSQSQKDVYTRLMLQNCLQQQKGVMSK